MSDILEAWPVPYEALCEAPAELLDEWAIRIQAKRTVEYREMKRREAIASAARKQR